jgi:2-polyprenyl-3-methyl-5-hydroxy-6-metoxy-1,4-benzoquinol methylase
MSRDDQIRWDRQHADRQTEQDAAPFLREIFESQGWDVPAARALDIACGSGRNAVYLAERGFEVTAVDISPVALAQGAERAAEEVLVDLMAASRPGKLHSRIRCVRSHREY